MYVYICALAHTHTHTRVAVVVVVVVVEVVVAVTVAFGGFHAVRVVMADQVPVLCEAGYGEGVRELSAVLRSSGTPSQRQETEIALFDTPDKWGIKKARVIFPNLKCVGGDPLHAWMDLVKHRVESLVTQKRRVKLQGRTRRQEATSQNVTSKV